MKKYNFIFVVLCYINTKDLKCFLENIKNVTGTYKVIVINSYYDDKTKKEFEKIAKKYNCDFLNVENKGYGAGNNKGIEFANNNYEYDFLVISNPDIQFLDFDIEKIKLLDNFIIGPMIKTLNGKNQNPYKPYNLWLVSGLEYYGIKYKFYLFWLIGALINKILREFIVVFAKIKKSPVKVFSLHGSCMLIGKFAMKNLADNKLYDENMFLFSEEEEVGNLAAKKNINLLYYNQLKVRHKEDGSMSLVKNKISQYEKESYIYCYKKWHGSK